MASTTNYSWSTPDDTALVKDGAAAIRSLGSAIDSTVFTNAGAAIAKTIVDAKGDIIAATAADTVSRLAVGANDTVLTADSSTATGLKWATASAGGLTSIATGSLTGSAVSITSIPSTYKELLLVLSNVQNTNANYGVSLTHNGFTSAYGVAGFYGDSSNGAALSNNQAASSFDLILGLGGAAVSQNMSWTIRYPNYTNASDVKRIVFEGSYRTHSGSLRRSIFGNGLQSTTEVITEISMNSNSFAAGTYILYGVN